MQFGTEIAASVLGNLLLHSSDKRVIYRPTTAESARMAHKCILRKEIYRNQQRR